MTGEIDWTKASGRDQSRPSKPFKKELRKQRVKKEHGALPKLTKPKVAVISAVGITIVSSILGYYFWTSQSNETASFMALIVISISSISSIIMLLGWGFTFWEPNE